MSARILHFCCGCVFCARNVNVFPAKKTVSHYQSLVASQNLVQPTKGKVKRGKHVAVDSTNQTLADQEGRAQLESAFQLIKYSLTVSPTSCYKTMADAEKLIWTTSFQTKEEESKAHARLERFKGELKTIALRRKTDRHDDV